MAYLNINIPTIYAKVRKEYLYDLDPKYKTESLDRIIFGMAAVTGRALLFHCEGNKWCVLLAFAYYSVFSKRI